MIFILSIIDSGLFYYLVVLFLLINCFFFFISRDSYKFFIKGFFSNYLRLFSLFMVVLVISLRLSYIYFYKYNLFTLGIAIKLIIFAIMFSFFIKFILYCIENLIDYIKNIIFIRRFINLKNDFMDSLNQSIISFYINYIILKDKGTTYISFCIEYLLLLDKYQSFLDKKFLISMLDFLHSLIMIVLILLLTSNSIGLVEFLFYYYFIIHVIFNFPFTLFERVSIVGNNVFDFYKKESKDLTINGESILKTESPDWWDPLWNKIKNPKITQVMREYSRDGIEKGKRIPVKPIIGVLGASATIFGVWWSVHSAAKAAALAQQHHEDNTAVVQQHHEDNTESADRRANEDRESQEKIARDNTESADRRANEDRESQEKIARDGNVVKQQEIFVKRQDMLSQNMRADCSGWGTLSKQCGASRQAFENGEKIYQDFLRKNKVIESSNTDSKDKE